MAIVGEPPAVAPARGLVVALGQVVGHLWACLVVGCGVALQEIVHLAAEVGAAVGGEFGQVRSFGHLVFLVYLMVEPAGLGVVAVLHIVAQVELLVVVGRHLVEVLERLGELALGEEACSHEVVEVVVVGGEELLGIVFQGVVARLLDLLHHGEQLVGVEFVKILVEIA